MLPEKQKRLFIAIDLPHEVRDTLGAVSNYFQHPAIRWTPLPNLHVTTHFIGAVQPEENDRIRNFVSGIAAQSKPFNLIFAELKVISKKRKPVMVWAAFEQCDAFVKLAFQMQQALPGDDSKTPVPHVTLARIKEGGLRELPTLPAVKKFSFPVRQVELWESHLGNGAPIYSSLEKFELGA